MCKVMEHFGKKIASLALDLCKAAAVGVGISVAIGLVLAGGGALFGSNGVHSAVEAAKNGLLLVFAFLLLIVAGMLLIKGKKQEQIRLNTGFRKHFAVIGPKSMLLALAVGMLATIIAVDGLQRSMM